MKTLARIIALALLCWLSVAVAIADPVPEAKWSVEGVMLQSFHWNSAGRVKVDGKSDNWYQLIGKHAATIGRSFNRIWMPPASEAAVEDIHGPAAQGYLPYNLLKLSSDYGNWAHLKQTLALLKQHGVSPIADMVINHVSPTPTVKNNGQRYQLNAATDRFIDLHPTDIVKESGGLGASDTGQQFSLVADVDHTSEHARRTYVNFLAKLGKMGFEGLRYDFAKGYSPRTLRLYNGVAKPKFSVAELWDDYKFADPKTTADVKTTDGKTSEAHRQQLLDYAKATGFRTAMFDFTTKAVLQEAVKNGEYWRLRDSQGRAAGLLGVAPAYAVTFVDNHDTGSSPGGNGKGGQKHWEFPGDKVMQGYAYILTHPGIPSVYWPHYFDWQSPFRQNMMQTELDKLMSVRKAAGVDATSTMRIVEADQQRYAAVIEGKHETLAMKIGPGAWQPPTTEGYKLVADGESYAVWSKASVRAK